jgi:hypothetical protein
LLAKLPEHTKIRELIAARRVQNARTVVVEPPEEEPEKPEESK